MEPVIQNLNDYTDKATKQTLQLLVDKKRKFEKFKKRELMWRSATLLSVGLFIVYIYYFVISGVSSYSIAFSYFFDREIHFYIVMFIGFQIGMVKYLLYKKDKAEKEYQDLRKETVKRSDDYWKQKEEWKSRHEVFEMMKKEFDINLYHESK
ncbi:MULTISPECIES: DUF2663 family protein [Sutcliffiella]|uniref:DUF2663 domain-containing protein n=1 Tax=Sutcliffiella cohnii TaxID=33932 RepID=A0A223KS16_9BACI|nr:MULTISPECIES: DUF2663 family protein [Sutcliffiella]AST92280.1 hypothetical protein BC6307_13780 [Sutcliffiella cohnii]WBL13511.1 DUF2663 family protein [Sutcliffiella sp. NC1]